MKCGPSRLIIVSNRLPVTVEQGSQGARIAPSSGGLVSALMPLLRNSAGVWIGWTGTDLSPDVAHVVETYSQQSNFALKPVFMTAEERSRFYCGFSNEVLWPLFHDLQSRCNFDPAYWDTHLAINQRFAESAAKEAGQDDLIWVHDYHLMSVASGLRRLGVTERLAYFHHIPFPSPDIFEKLPWRAEILTALLDFDVIGFQTLRDRRNFVACLRQFVHHAEIRTQHDHLVVDEPSRRTVVGAFPIGIDFDELATRAASSQVAARAESIKHHFSGVRIVLGVDRLDYTKGIPERLAAFRLLLELHPELHRKVTLLQVVVPSREDIPKYRELKTHIQRAVSEINGHYAEPGWVPVHYIHRCLDRGELLAFYRAADIALVTPLKDGMNLVAKEYCAARVNHDGVLILSEFAGAAFQLRKGALLVNPYHTRAAAHALHFACNMTEGEQRRRMRRLRSCVRRENIFRWRDAFCDCGESFTAQSSLTIDPRAQREGAVEAGAV